MKIEITQFQRRRKIPQAKIRGLCLKLFRRFKTHKVVKRQSADLTEFADLHIVFVGLKKSRDLNKRYRRKDYATDILSFEPAGRCQGLGELVLCYPVLKKQARDHGLSLQEEIDYLLIHGFLHLLGYDHERSRREEVKMMALQDKLFAKYSLRKKG